MPFKLRLRKSRQYNVVTKSLFVICVELLDNSIVECTLSADSLGYDCLDNVCQRLGLNQPKFFGLRYVSEKSYPRVRWVELDRPLKKQLDKYAQEAYLYLRIMYYVNDVGLLQDEMTRYHYFLQLKSDVMEGRLRCSYEEAVVLAGYRLQAEFGDYDPERPALQYLKDLILVPKHLVTNEAQLDAVTEAVAEQHAKLVGVPQAVAECCYIVEAQNLDGYGQERFLAKEEPAGEALVATSLQGILVMRNNTERVVFYKWEDITNLVNQKRMFGIECQRSEENIQFFFDDSEAARYVWKLAVLQHTFYKQTLETLQSMQQQSEEKDEDLVRGIVTMGLNGSVPNVHSTSAAAVSAVADPFPRSSSAQGRTEEKYFNAPAAVLPHSVSSPALSTLNAVNHGLLSAATATPYAQSQQIVDNPGRSLAASQQSLRGLLPAYRHTPDYETAVRVKYGDEIASLILNTAAAPRNVQGANLQQQQQLMLQQYQMLQMFKPPPPYPYNKMGSSSTPDLPSVQQNSAAAPVAVETTHTQMLQPNGEPIYQNIPVREQNRSNPSLAQDSRTAQASGGRRRWGAPAAVVPAQHNSQPAKREPGLANGLGGSQPIMQDLVQQRRNPPVNLKDHLRQHVEARMTDGQLLLEFEMIPRRKANADFSTAAHPENQSRNRYQDVLPYEENRVRLTPRRDNRLGYINASHISASIGGSQRFYVAAQGPLPSTVLDFWQMVWESDIYVIALLADNTNPGSVPKAAAGLRTHPSSTSMGGYSGFAYWPQQEGGIVEFGDFRIRRLFGNQSQRQALSKLDLIHVPSEKQRSIWHLQYWDWPDFGSPQDIASYLGFLEELGNVRRHAMQEVPQGKNVNTPVLIHCGAGVGRTGVTIACDVLLSCLDHNLEVDVPKVITHLRQQRMLMVQTVAQYRLIYAILLFYLDRSRLI